LDGVAHCLPAHVRASRVLRQSGSDFCRLAKTDFYPIAFLWIEFFPEMEWAHPSGGKEKSISPATVTA